MLLQLLVAVSSDQQAKAISQRNASLRSSETSLQQGQTCPRSMSASELQGWRVAQLEVVPAASSVHRVLVKLSPQVGKDSSASSQHSQAYSRTPEGSPSQQGACNQHSRLDPSSRSKRTAADSANLRHPEQHHPEVASLASSSHSLSIRCRCSPPMAATSLRRRSSGTRNK